MMVKKRKIKKKRLLTVDAVEMTIPQGSRHPGLFNTSSKPATKQAGSI